MPARKKTPDHKCIQKWDKVSRAAKVLKLNVKSCMLCTINHKAKCSYEIQTSIQEAATQNKVPSVEDYPNVQAETKAEEHKHYTRVKQMKL